MPSTYSTTLRLQMMQTGEKTGQWGSITNTNLGTLLEQAITGLSTITVSDVGDTTLTALDGAVDQSRSMYLDLTGTITGARNVLAPSISSSTGQPITKLYVVKNSTTGGFAVTLKTSAVGSTGVSVPNGAVTLLWSDGTDVTNALTYLASVSNSAITNSTIDNSPIGSTTPSTAAFTNGSAQNWNITTGGTLNNVSVVNGQGNFLTISSPAATITGGSINNASVGATTVSTGAFSTLTSTGGAINGTVGAGTPAAGSFTTLGSSGAYTNTVADGSTPMNIASTTRVSNLNVARSGFSDTTTIVDDTSTNSTFYPILSAATSGNNALKVSSTKWTFNPSTGAMVTAGAFTSASLTPVSPVGVAYGGTGNTTGYLAPRVTSVADANSITPNADTTDEVTQSNSTVAGTLTINAPTGTPVDGQKLIIRVTCTNAQTLSFNAIYRSSTDLGFPSATSGSSKTDYLGFVYNSSATKWDLLAKVFGF